VAIRRERRLERSAEKSASSRLGRLAPSRNASCSSHPVRRDKAMSNIFYIIGVVVVIVAILGFLGLR
jgi:hypothetical protein